MRVPYNWLMEYLEADISPEDLAHVLTMGGLEVEEIRNWTSEDGTAQDRILVTKITANRGDLLSLVGVARHAAALLGTTWKLPEFPAELIADPVTGATTAASEEVFVELADTTGCPRYSALLVDGVKVEAGPKWLAHRLESAGVRPLANVVDCTNYVMLELGQPLHAFDHNLLKDGSIIVRRAHEGERITTIDRQERLLTAEDVVITDPTGPIALAGVMGGSDSEMTWDTTRVLLESAHFDPTAIRKTSLRLGLSTEASYRFERNVDPAGTLRALARVAHLITQTAGGTVVAPALDACARDFSPRSIALRPERCNAVLGTDLSPAEMARCLQAIDFAVGEENGCFAVQVPQLRWDIEREIDLIEEIAIIYGYERLPKTVPGRLAQSGLPTREQKLRRLVGETLRQCGLSENLSFSFSSPAELDRLNYPPDAPERTMLALSNPMIDTQTHMRTTLIPALLTACESNVHQRVTDVALYEINKVFIPRPGQELPDEPMHVGGVLMGSSLTADWNVAPEDAAADFFQLKSIVEQLCDILGIDDYGFRRTTHPAFHPGRCAALYIGDLQAGVLGEIEREVQRRFDLPTRVYLFELQLDLLLAAACDYKRYNPLPRYPATLRDLAFIVSDDEAHNAQAVREAIIAAGGEFLAMVEAFDVFTDEKRLGPGLRNLAFRLEFRAADRTLTDEEVDAALENIKHAVTAGIGAKIRDY